jgi:two-component system NtrC family response regulator
MAVLENYTWPGNIRELSNVIAQAAAICEGQSLRLKHLPSKLLKSENKDSLTPQDTTKLPALPRVNPNYVLLEELLNETADKLVDKLSLEDEVNYTEVVHYLKAFETNVGVKLIEKALRQTLGNRKEATKLLNLNPRTLRYLLNEKNK